MKTFKIPEHVCACGYKLNLTHNPMNDQAPREGDFSMCGRCGQLYVFGKDLSKYIITDKELDELKKQTYWAKIEEVQKFLKKTSEDLRRNLN